MQIMIIERPVDHGPEGCNRAVSEISDPVQRKKMDKEKRHAQEEEYLASKKMLRALRP